MRETATEETMPVLRDTNTTTIRYSSEMAPGWSWSRTATKVITAKPMTPNKECAAAYQNPWGAASGLGGPSDDECRSSIPLISLIYRRVSLQRSTGAGRSHTVAQLPNPVSRYTRELDT